MWFWRRRSAITMFEQRFEADGDAFLFRMGRQGIPVRVSPAERNDFVSSFRLSYRVALALFIGILLFSIAMQVAVYAPRNQEVPELLAQVSMWLILGAFLAGFYWIWYTPNRALAGRTPCGPALTRDERKGRAIDRATWPQMLLSTSIGAGLVIDGVVPGPIGQHPFEVGFGVLILTLGVRAAWTKVRRRSAADSLP